MDEFPDLFLKPGDLVFNRTNSPELVGKTAVFRGLPVPCSFASYLIRIRIDVIDSRWVSHYINSPAVVTGSGPLLRSRSAKRT